jgi:hypothetical protein
MTSRPVMTPRPAAVPPPIPGLAGGLTYETLQQVMIIGRDPAAKQAVRSAFYHLTFDRQVDLIGKFTNERLDDIIGTHIKMNWQSHSNPPKAFDVWQLLWNRHCVPSAEKIAIYFPQLKSRASAEQQRDRPDQAPADVLAGYLTGLYEFWSVRLYPYDEEGKVGKASVLASPARFLNDEQITTINDRAGLPGLGLHIKGYADFLAKNIEELLFDGKLLKDWEQPTPAPEQARSLIKLRPLATLEF